MTLATRLSVRGKIGRLILTTLISLPLVAISVGYGHGAGAAGPVIVKISVDDWVLQEIPMKQLATQYNKLHPGVTVQIELALGTWDTKALAQIKQGGIPCGTLIWSPRRSPIWTLIWPRVCSSLSTLT